MKKCYKVFLGTEYEHPDDIEVVAEGSLIRYVKELLADERINQENIDFWLSNGNKMPTTEQECIDFLENDGWYVERITMYE